MTVPRPLRHFSHSVLARLAGSPRRNFVPGKHQPEQILLIRLDGTGEMLCTLPLLWALRESWPQARITVVTEEPGRHIARMCQAVNDVLPIEATGSYWTRYLLAASRLQNYDVTIAAKSTYNRWLAQLTRLTNSPVRIGVEPTPLMHTPFFYTHNVGPATDQIEHRVDTLMRLAEPLGVEPPGVYRFDLQPGKDALYNARTLTGDLTAPIGEVHRPTPYVVVDISSDTTDNWTFQQYSDFIAGLAGDRRVPVAITYENRDDAMATRLVSEVQTFAPVVKVPTKNTEELAAVIQYARLLLTPHHAIGHLAAAVHTPAVILWFSDDFELRHSLQPHQRFLRADEEPETATPTFALNLMAELWNSEGDELPPLPPSEGSLI